MRKNFDLLYNGIKTRGPNEAKKRKIKIKKIRKYYKLILFLNVIISIDIFDHIETV